MRVGFIADNRFPSLRFGPSSWLRGVPSSTGAGLMRAGWMIHANRGWYEWYRPGRRYDALVFVKSFSDDCISLARRAHARGVKIFFDINVNYFETDGTFYYEGMAPTAKQRENAEAMLALSDGVIVASEELRDLCAARGSRTVWIPDHVDLNLVPASRTTGQPAARLPLLWSGQAVKLFELLAIEEVLREYRSRVQVKVVTNQLSALANWSHDLRARWKCLVSEVPFEFIPFVSIPDLLQYYSRQQGVMISPRFMDNSYNRTHTAWKIILGMACGRVALASCQRSYLTVAHRAGGRGIRICSTEREWRNALNELLSPEFDWLAEEEAAASVVSRHYSTAKTATHHRQVLEAWMAGDKK